MGVPIDGSKTSNMVVPSLVKRASDTGESVYRYPRGGVSPSRGIVVPLSYLLAILVPISAYLPMDRLPTVGVCNGRAISEG